MPLTVCFEFKICLAFLATTERSPVLSSKHEHSIEAITVSYSTALEKSSPSKPNADLSLVSQDESMTAGSFGLRQRHDGTKNDEIKFDLSKALNNLNLHGISIPDRFTKTPAVSPVRARRRLNSMNGDSYGSGDERSDTSSPPSLLELLSPSGASSSSSSFSQVFDDIDSACGSVEETSPCFFSVIQTTILEEAVEMSLPDERKPGTSLNSSILSSEYEDNIQTPAKVEYCGITWPCCHSTSNVLVDDGLHAKICTSLGMEHWTCWQATYQASPSPVGVRRSYSRGRKKLDSLRRTLIPIEPKKTHSFSPFLKLNDSFASCESGYESDPQVHLLNKTVSSPSCLRATTVDELFNERLRLVLHSAGTSRCVTFWLERGMVGLAVPPQICWHDGNNRTSIPLLDITKILEGHADPSIPASSQRCFRIFISEGTQYTLEVPNSQMKVDLTNLLKMSVASLAAAVLTHGNIDVFFTRKEAWI